MKFRTQVQSHTSRSKDPYDVVVDTDAGWAWCSCPAWKWGKTPADVRRCKHTDEVLAALTLNADRRVTMNFSRVEVAKATPGALSNLAAALTVDVASITEAPASRFDVLDLDAGATVKAPRATARDLDLD